MSEAPVYLSGEGKGDGTLFNTDYISEITATEKHLMVRFAPGGSWKFTPGKNERLYPAVMQHDLVEAIARAKANGGGVLALTNGRFEIAKVARAA